MRTLDIKAVQAFVYVSELKSFTRAADLLDSTQSAVSLLIQRLEKRLGHRLIERTPRLIRLSSHGLAFLDAARDLLAAHQRAIGAFGTEQRRLTLGLSQQLVGAELPGLLRRLSEEDPALQLELRVAASPELMTAFDAGALDAAIVIRHDDHRRNGEHLFAEPFGWIATTGFEHRTGTPVRIATQGESCGIRASAVAALDAAGIAWTEVFVGRGAATVGAAASAGLAVAVLSRRAAPAGTVDVGKRLGLPPLPAHDVVLYSTATDARTRHALQNIAAAFRR